MNGILRCFLSAIAILVVFISFGQKKETEEKITVGVYYFDGWTGKTFHLSKMLKEGFPERKPIYGWITSTQSVMDSQIIAASEAGIDFFNFCWYYNSKDNDAVDNDPKNNALKLYLSSPNKSGLKFSILVANHSGYTIREEHWDRLIEKWCSILIKPNYQTSDNKPLITFFSVKSIIRTFGTVDSVKLALQKFRAMSMINGLKGLTIAVCTDPSEEEVNQAKACGFDVLTGYNYHNIGYSKSELIIPIDSLIAKEDGLRDNFLKYNMPYIPVSTLNWDQRPWGDIKKEISNSPRYEGFSGTSVYNSINGVKNWALKNPVTVTKEKMVMIYAWNEYGEGAWLTPSVTWDNDLLNALKKGLGK